MAQPSSSQTKVRDGEQQSMPKPTAPDDPKGCRRAVCQNRAVVERQRTVGLYSYGLHGYGLYTYGCIVMAYIVMTYSANGGRPI